MIVCPFLLDDISELSWVPRSGEGNTPNSDVGAVVNGED